jgi:hypothetical protein
LDQAHIYKNNTILSEKYPRPKTPGEGILFSYEEFNHGSRKFQGKSPYMPVRPVVIPEKGAASLRDGAFPGILGNK